jgi:hypothetical protein
MSSKPKNETPQRPAGPEGAGRSRSVSASDANDVPVDAGRRAQPVVGARGATFDAAFQAGLVDRRGLRTAAGRIGETDPVADLED